ncbi:MAG: ArnT family glycosyltransferase [Pseudodesulfovibrio sp.]|uniref:ArnT family glycosyltransferase n=1 Tax=Pseudodesulfovibrio sp. TaxID=2035812 RepID=UPI003D0EC57D
MAASQDNTPSISGYGVDAFNAWRRQADRWFDSHRGLAILLALLTVSAFSLAIRFFWSQPIHMGGDAFYKWGIARRAAENLAFPIDATHHGMRWSIMIPVYLIQLVFGDAASNYYIWPFASSTILACFGFLLVEKLSDWRWGLLAAFMFVTYDGMVFNGSQFLPMGPAAMYLIAALYFLLRHIRERKTWALVASAALLFCSYGAKITSIYYFPAFIIVIALSESGPGERRFNRWKPLAVFLLTLLALFMLETAVIRTTLHQPNRIAVLKSGIHGDNPTAHFYDNLDKARDFFAKAPYALPPYPQDINWKQLSVTPWEYFWNFLIYYDLKPWAWASNLILYAALLLAGVTLVRRNKSLYFLCIPYLFGFFAHAYAIRGLHPFLRPERILPRYLLLLFLLAIALLIAFTADALKRKTARPVLRYALLGLVLVLALKQADDMRDVFPKMNGYAATVATEHAITAARSNGRAIVVSASRYKNVWGYYQIFGNPDTIPDYMDLFFYVTQCPEYHFPAFGARDKKICDYQFATIGNGDWNNYCVIVEHNGNTDIEAMENFTEVKMMGAP